MRLGLVLSGGGAKGAFEAGVYEAMEEADLRPTVLAGTSAGAINCAGIGAGFTADRLAELWTSQGSSDVFGLRHDVQRLLNLRGLLGGGTLADRALDAIGWTWYLDTSPLRRTLIAAIGGEAVPLVDDVIVSVSAIEMLSGQLVRFTSTPPPPHRDDPRFRTVSLSVDHLLASAAIPILFRPATVEGLKFWDGGVVANTPLRAAFAYEPDAIVVVMTTPARPDEVEPQTLGEVTGLLIDTLLGYSLEADLEHARTVNKLCRVAPEATHRREVELLVIRPGRQFSGVGSFLDFDPELARQLVDHGREVGRKALASWQPGTGSSDAAP